MATPTTKPEVKAQPAGEQKRPGGPRNAPRRKQQSRFGTQLKEKQDLKALFGIQEAQLRLYYERALRFRGQTGPTLVSMLERRLDNAIFRAGFAQTRPQSRQMSTHKLFAVNGKGVDVPSYSLKIGDVVSVREGKRKKSYFTSFDKRMQGVNPPSWISINPGEYSFTITALPSYEEANLGIDIRAIVEYFAR